MKRPINLLQAATLPMIASSPSYLTWWEFWGRVAGIFAVIAILFLLTAEKKKSANSFRWLILLPTILLPAYLFWWVFVPLAIVLIPNPFWWEWMKKMIWDPFWWVILFLVILWVPFLRVWWWFFLPLMLGVQLRTLYLWWINWDYDYAKARWVILEIIPPKELLIPVKAMEDVFSVLWPIWDRPTFREKWCDGELDNADFGPFWFSWEIVSIEGKIHFYIRFLEQHRLAAEMALYAHYPDIEIHEVPDYTKLVPPTIPNEEWDMYGEDWILRQPAAYPIKTYEKFFEPQGERIAAEEKRIDPIIGLLEGMSKLGPGEHYWVQFITVPINDLDEPEWRKEGKKIIDKLSKRPEDKEPTLMEDLAYVGKQIAMGPEKEGSGESAKYSWLPQNKEETGEREMVLTPGEREIITEVENKMKKPVFRTSVRGVYVAKRDAWNSPNGKIMRSYASHFLTANLNTLGFTGDTRPKVHFFWRKRRVFLRARKMFRMSVLRFPAAFPDPHRYCPILSSEEMATLYHFPLRVSGMVGPTMAKVESKKAGPPPNLPTE
ncbi:MAG: hypothetical protein ABSA74_00440 [Candidatus Staskawiczbacteria bacterium]|jgi:hypothetical protein